MMAAGFSAATSQARRIAVGDDFPVVSATTLSGQEYNRQAGSDRPLLIAFLSAGQKQSQQAAEDLQRVVTSYAKYRHQMDIVIVLDDPVLKDAFKDAGQDAGHALRLIHDTEKQLWGQFHIIAAPTVIIADKSDKVASVIAGHGYDFMPSLRFHLNESLGVAQEVTAADVGKVKTVQNKTASARLQRHLKMAKMLLEKGNTDAAMQQLEMARQLDPNDLQLAFQVAEIYCSGNHPQKALDAVKDLKPTLKKDIAHLQLISGWANRLAGDLLTARDLLEKAAAADPRSAQALFQLGQVYEATSQNDLALKSYKKALSILLDAK
ncbi:MAG: tetratricopeptide repeat protein [Planctomycetota bacterium]|jgi:tetratricopeptide (TPR) repeat protein